MRKLFLYNKYFTASECEDYKKSLFEQFGKERIENQINYTKRWIEIWIEPAYNYSRKYDNQYLKCIIEHSNMEKRSESWIHSDVVVIAACELGYDAKLVSPRTYRLNLRIKKDATSSIENMHRSGFNAVREKKYRALLEKKTNEELTIRLNAIKNLKGIISFDDFYSAMTEIQAKLIEL